MALLLTLTFPAGSSISDALDLPAGEVVQLITPPEWTSALLSFEVSRGADFYDLVEIDGSFVTMTIQPNAIIRSPSGFAGTQNSRVRVRSGTKDYPVVQKERRDFQLYIE